MAPTDDITAGDVGNLAEVIEPDARAGDGIATIEVPTSTGAPAVIHVPEDCTDPVVRYEDPDGVKHEWVNPNAVQPITNPTEDDDVIWDAALNAYVPRVSVSETGGSSDDAG